MTGLNWSVPINPICFSGALEKSSFKTSTCLHTIKKTQPAASLHHKESNLIAFPPLVYYTHSLYRCKKRESIKYILNVYISGFWIWMCQYVLSRQSLASKELDISKHRKSLDRDLKLGLRFDFQVVEPRRSTEVNWSQIWWKSPLLLKGINPMSPFEDIATLFSIQKATPSERTEECK